MAAAGGRHVTLPLTSKNPLILWQNSVRIGRLVAAEGVGIVHARSRAPAWSTLVAARRTGARFVTTYHGAYSEDLPLKRRYNAVMAMGERVIVASRFVADLVLARHGTEPARLRLIPRGVDPMAFDPAAIAPARAARLAEAWCLPPSAPVVMLPGRLTRWKGAEVLLAALPRLARRDAMAVLVGGEQSAGYGDELRRLAARAGVADRLVLAGPCADMPAALALADVVISASTAPEAFGRVVIEAQAMARPVVVADHGGAAEAVAEGETGWRVKPSDAEALAAAIDHALALPPLERQALGERARQAVRARFTTAAMQRATLAVYAELAD
jgi:glycosyltransferase involved in cell wall biosynthesis